MNDGVKLLLERMKTNPEEFTTGHKWVGLINSYKEYLNEEDAKVFNDAYNGLMQQTFTEQVMKELLAPEEDNSLGKPWYSKQSLMPLAGTTQGQSLANSQHQNQVEHVKAHLEALQKQKQKPHKTLFGRLYNHEHNNN
jgi:hypothetical protein